MLQILQSYKFLRARADKNCEGIKEPPRIEMTAGKIIVIGYKDSFYRRFK